MGSAKKDDIAEKEFYAILSTVSKCLDEQEIKELKIAIKNEQDVNRKVELMQKLTKLKRGSGLDERD